MEENTIWWAPDTQVCPIDRARNLHRGSSTNGMSDLPSIICRGTGGNMGYQASPTVVAGIQDIGPRTSGLHMR